MEVFEAIAKRHSYRGPYKDAPVPREDLKRIVEAGLQAPSGCNAQTTRFIIVDDPELVQKIASMPGCRQSVSEAKAFICCIVDKQPESVFENLSFVVEDCAAAVENMLLAITDLGYATVWIDGWLRVEGRAEQVGQILGVPEDKIVRIILPLGIPAESHSPKEKKPFEERRVWNECVS